LKDVWQTPNDILELVGNIDLDPCAGEDTHIGDVNYSNKDVNGLKENWFGRTFVNPPFSEKKKWLKKAVEEVEYTECIFFVTPDGTDTVSWWHKYVTQADCIWFSEGRISYIDPDTGEKQKNPTFGTAVSMFGEPGKKTLRRFNKEGQLLKTVEIE
jgi:phage N-6-adenine-methyltransferase